MTKLYGLAALYAKCYESFLAFAITFETDLMVLTFKVLYLIFVAIEAGLGCQRLF